AKAIELYLVPAPNGTNFADADNTTPNPALLAGYALVRAVTTAQRIAIPGVTLPPHKLEIYIRNQTDQQMSAGFTVTLWPYRGQGGIPRPIGGGRTAWAGSKPPPTARVNWSHPLARELRANFRFAEGVAGQSANTPVDVTRDSCRGLAGRL